MTFSNQASATLNRRVIRLGSTRVEANSAAEASNGSVTPMAKLAGMRSPPSEAKASGMVRPKNSQNRVGQNVKEKATPIKKAGKTPRGSLTLASTQREIPLPRETRG